MRVKGLIRTVAVSCFLSLVATAVLAQTPVSQQINDLRLETAVRLALLENDDTRSFDIHVQAADGVVVLSGLVPTLGDRATVHNAIVGFQGIRVLRNDLRLEGQPDTPILDPVQSVSEQPVDDTPAAYSEENPGVQLDSDANNEPQYHRVERGDTLYNIARRFNTTLRAIQELNELNTTTIRIGQRLRVK